MTSIERAFTGGVILSPAATDLLTHPVPLSAFTDLRVASVYQAAVDLYHRSPEVAGDAIAVVAQLQAQGELERVGGAVEVFRLVEEGCNSASVSWHASRMLEAAQIRALGAAAMRIQQQVNTTQATTSAEDTDALVRFAWDQLETATSGVQTRNVLLMSDVFDRWKNREEKPFTPIGLELFTKITGLHGVHQGHVVLVAARPAVGKSTVLAQAAVAAATSGAGVLFVTLEMVGEEVLERCMANQLATNVQSLREYGVAHLPTVLENIRVMDTATAVTDIAAAVRQSRRTQTPIELVIVDYLQLLTPPGRTGENRQTEVAAISRALKRLAVDERVGVLAASQLNRALETRSDKRPSMADLRESGQLEADADVIMLMHRDPDEPFEIEFIVAKNRHGANGSFAAEPDFARSLILETRGSDAKAV